MLVEGKVFSLEIKEYFSKLFTIPWVSGTYRDIHQLLLNLARINLTIFSPLNSFLQGPQKSAGARQ